MRPRADPARSASEAVVQVVSLYRSETKIYPRAVSGWFMGWRWALVALTQLVFYGLPWLAWNGRQAVLFDLAARRFYLFGLVLYPQDFVYLTVLLLISAYALFLFTAVAGRLWCGYACPQTVYTEVFMQIERLFEGDRNARIRLDAAPWSWPKLARKAGTQVSWVALALWTGFSFVGYFTPIRVLGGEVLAGTLGPWESFWLLFYGLATYGNAGYMREQVCKYMCPYARFQSAMFDKDTLIISYDSERGEPRGRNAERGRKGLPKNPALGDCVDCDLCVQVCPTGIDIRDGLQYECIGCAACVDVCNGVMDKVGYPRGLVRYDTQNGLAGHLSAAARWGRVLRPRVLVYTAVLLLIVAALAASLALRREFRVDVVRDRATLARQIEDGVIENLYRVQIMNASERPQRFRVTAEGLAGLTAQIVPERGVTEIEVAGTEARWVTLSLRVAAESRAGIPPGAHAVQMRIERLSDGGVESALIERTTFVMPRL
jgi:cytochrome c oxidase accessory protein FixG